MKHPAVYIVASKRNGTLYVGVTSNLIKRVYEHKEWVIEGFTKKYGCKQFVQEVLVQFNLGNGITYKKFRG